VNQGEKASTRVAPFDTIPALGPGDAATPSRSFDELYERWFETVSRWVRALGACDADRDDVVQEVFLVVHRRLSDFDGQNEAGWLYQIARRKVRDYRRLLWIKHLFGLSNVSVEGSLLSTHRGPLEELETKRKSELLTQLLDQLNEDQRAAFVLFEIEGVGGEEIAALTGVPVNTIWGRIFKARKALRKQLQRLEKRPSHHGRTSRRR
jgi:RNA polymerase sigma-70 factor (ECF subfamily)